MTDASATPPPPMKGLVEYTTLCASAGIGLFLAIVLGFVSGTLGSDYPTDAQLFWRSASGALANLALTVAVASTVGAVVLSGVRRLLHRVRTGSLL